MRVLLVRVVVLLVTVVLVVELAGLLLGLALGLLAVDEVGTLGLGETVDFTTSESGDGLFGEAVVDFLACENDRQKGM